MPKKPALKRRKTNQNGDFVLPLLANLCGRKNRTKTDRTKQNGVFALPLRKLLISIHFIRFYQFLSVFVGEQRKTGPNNFLRQYLGLKILNFENLSKNLNKPMGLLLRNYAIYIYIYFCRVLYVCFLCINTSINNY